MAAAGGDPYRSRTAPSRRPPPTTPPPPDFAEAERALALISGKDPEIVAKARVLRELDAEEQAARSQRRAFDDAARRRARRLELLRYGAMGGVVVVALAAGAFVFAQRSGQRERDDLAATTLRPAGAPFVSQGFSQVLAAPSSVTGRADGCIVAVAATPAGPAPVSLQLGTNPPVAGVGNVAVCMCEEEAVTATSSAPDAIVGVFQAAGVAIGGARGLGSLDPPPAVVAEGGAACERDHLSRWLEGRAATVAGARAAAAKGPLADGLRAQGLTIAGFARGSGKLVPIVPARATCFVAGSSTPGESLTLAARDGSVIADGPALAWCEADAVPRSISRKGDGDVVVASSESSAVGSLVGIVARARAAGLGAPVTFVDPTMLASASIDALRGSHVIEPKTEPEGVLAADPTLRLVAVSRSHSADPFDPGTLICGDSATAQSLCFLPPQRAYRSQTRLGIAHAAAPFWTPATDDPRALAAMLPVLELVRSLATRGFEPTTLEGVTEVYAAVDVTGRASEDAVVVIALSPSAPWVLPLSDQPTSWKLGEPPRVVPLEPGAKITLRNPMLVTMPPATRRTLVLRRTKR